MNEFGSEITSVLGNFEALQWVLLNQGSLFCETDQKENTDAFVGRTAVSLNQSRYNVHAMCIKSHDYEVIKSKVGVYKYRKFVFICFRCRIFSVYYEKNDFR